MSFLQNSNRDDSGDVQLMFPGDRFPVTAGTTLRSTGWRGGLFVRYVTAGDDFTVEVSDGNEVCGFILFQSENYQITPPTGTGPGSPQNFTSQQLLNPQGGNNVVTMINGGTRAFFRVFETVALNGAGNRAGGAITYALNEDLKISENGLLCNDTDGNLAAAGVTTPQVVGIVSAVPSTANGSRLCLDMKY
tara:strand:- start:201 stop:773 length:573 start_codon:yes stop_codon:yes gene_type:complete